MAQPVPDTIRAVWQFNRTNNDDMVNVFHFHLDDGTPLTQTIADNLADIMSSAWGDNLQGRVDDTVVFQNIIFTDIRVDGGEQFTSAVGATGTGGGELLPPQDAAVITWLTAGTGKSARGRSYMGGFTEADNMNDGRITSTLHGLLEDFADQLIADMIVPATPLVVVSRFHNNGERTPPITNEVTGHNVRTVWRTQRRRAFRV